MREQESARPSGDALVPLVGHDAALKQMTGALRSGRGAQSTLLVGPPSVGKTTAALRLAQAYLCEAPDDRPCGACRGCRMTASGAHPDLCLLDAPLKIAAVRELQRRLALAPMEGAWHVAILPEIETASHGAANSLLKTLEEPPSGAILLLTASDPSALLPTVRSRCRIVRFRALDARTAQAALVRLWDAAEADAELLARLSAGRIGWAVRALADPALLEARTDWLTRLEGVLAEGPAARQAHADGWGRKTEALVEGLQSWRGWWRDVLLLQHGLEDRIVNLDRVGALRAAAGRYSPEASVRALRAVDGALGQLARSANAPLATAILLFEMPA